MTAATDPQALVIGAGPAGLMAAGELAHAGVSVLICDAMPSPARKFLMAGKSGLNLTMDVPFDALLPAYEEAAEWLAPALRGFDAAAVQDWARGLGQQVFTGTTGRVFPTAMKASPLLRAWLGRLGESGVALRSRWRWTGWKDDSVIFDTPHGPQSLTPAVTVLALGGASWSRLGSDGAWADILTARGIPLTPFAPANAGLCVAWSGHMVGFFGTPLKGIALRAGGRQSRGEAVISARGLEGGGVYGISRAVREGHDLTLDLLPDLDPATVARRLSRPRGKASLSNHLRKTLRLTPARIALLQEFARPLPVEPAALAHLIKAVPVRHAGLRPIDEAISTAGGVPRAAVDGGLMLRSVPGVFCAGEMLDWEAPTGGYLLTGSMATGRWAGRAAAAHLRQQARA